jgi:hypothetical protein
LRLKVPSACIFLEKEEIGYGNYSPPASNCWSAGISWFFSNKNSGTVQNGPPFKT